MLEGLKQTAKHAVEQQQKDQDSDVIFVSEVKAPRGVVSGKVSFSRPALQTARKPPSKDRLTRSLRSSLEGCPQMLAALEGKTLSEESLSFCNSAEIVAFSKLPLESVRLDMLTGENQSIFLRYAVKNPSMSDPAVFTAAFEEFLQNALTVHRILDISLPFPQFLSGKL